MYFSGIGEWSSVGTYSLTRGSNVMTVNMIAWNGPEIIFGFTIIQRQVLTSGLKKTLLILLEEFLVPLLFPDAPVLSGMFSDAVLIQRFYPFHLRLGIHIFHFSWALTLLKHWAFGRGVLMRPSPQFFNVCDHNVSLPDFSCIQYIYEEFSW